MIGMVEAKGDIRMHAALQNRNRVFIRLRDNRGSCLNQEIEAFSNQAREDLVLAFEIAIDRSRGITDPLGQITQGEVFKSFIDKAPPGRSEDQVPDVGFVLFAYQLDGHNEQ